MSRTIRLTIFAFAAAGLTAVLGCPTSPTGGAGGIFDLPPTPIIASNVVRGVVPLEVSFDSSRSTDDGLIVRREWDFGDGATSVDIRPTHTYTQTGEFLVRLTLTDDAGNTASRTRRIIVTEAPVAVIRVDRTAADSAPALINFDGSASFDPDGKIESYRWEFGDGSTELLSVVPHTYSRPGTYRVRLTVTDDNGITGFAEVLILIGIRTPTISLRVPPADVTNIVAPQTAPLWIQGVFDIEPGVPRTIRVGIDGDRDVCEAQSILADPASLATQAVLAGHGNQVTGAAFSPDGTMVLTASLDGTLRLYLAASGDLLTTYDAAGPVTSVAFSPDGTRFVYGRTNGSVVLRDRVGGAIVREFLGHSGSVNDVDFSPDGTQVLSGASDRRALLWNVSDGAILRDFGHDLAVNAVAFSRGDQALVATGGEDARIRIWNTTGGVLVATLTGHTEAVNALAFSRDGLALLSGGDDNVARLWSPFVGVQVQVYSGHTDDVISVAFSRDGQQVLTGSVDATYRLWDSVTGQQLRQARPCSSPVTAVAFSPAGTGRVLAAIAARNDIQLDAERPAGNDLDITYPRALQLQSVAALNGEAVPVGTYFLWAEINSDRTDPVRVYANPVVNVVAPLPEAITTTSIPPPAPLVNDAADILVDPNALRQIIDLGPLARGDRIFLSLLTVPGFGATYAPTAVGGTFADFGVAILDNDQNLYAWYQPGFILFSPEAKLVIGRNSPHYYLVTDGGNALRVRIQRNSGLFEPRRQRVYVRFDGAPRISAGDVTNFDVPALDAADFGGFFMPPRVWGETQSAAIRNQVMATLREVYDGFDVQFVGSHESSGPPEFPYQTMYVGGDRVGLYGISDYIDPRNQTQIGQGITFATAIARDAVQTPQLIPVVDEFDVGRAIGLVAAHEVGHLMGLRHTDTAGDLMEGTCGPTAAELTLPRTLMIAPVTLDEQFGAFFCVGPLGPVGIQNAPQYLAEVVGLTNP